MPDPDQVLRKRGEDAEVLEDLSADDQVTTAMLSRKKRVLNWPDFTLRVGAPDGGTAPGGRESVPLSGTGSGTDQSAHRHFRHPGRSLFWFYPAGTDLEAGDNWGPCGHRASAPPLVLL